MQKVVINTFNDPTRKRPQLTKDNFSLVIFLLTIRHTLYQGFNLMKTIWASLKAMQRNTCVLKLAFFLAWLLILWFITFYFDDYVFVVSTADVLSWLEFKNIYRLFLVKNVH